MFGVVISVEKYALLLNNANLLPGRQLWGRANPRLGVVRGFFQTGFLEN